MCTITDKFCVCNNCDTVMIDLNSDKQPEYELPAKKIKNMEYFWDEGFEYPGCPNCETDSYLSDVDEYNIARIREELQTA